jgi:hypothetical protein
VERKRQERETNDDDADRLPKKTYAAPVITEYGSVAKLTQSGAGSIADATFSQLKSCL